VREPTKKYHVPKWVLKIAFDDTSTYPFLFKSFVFCLGRVLKKIIFLLYLCYSLSALANDCGKWFDNLNSPLCTDAKYIFLAGSALTAGVYFSNKDINRQVRDQALKKKRLGVGARIGEIIGWGYLNGAYILGTFIAGGEKNKKRSEFMLEATGYTVLSTVLLKESIKEQRPDGSNEFDSFPSGHASAAFAFASVVTANHSMLWGGLAHLTAAFIGYSRIEKDRHYLHDVIFGATLGMSYGWGIYLNHKKYNKPYWFAVAPTNNLDGMQIAFKGYF